MWQVPEGLRRHFGHSHVGLLKLHAIKPKRHLRRHAYSPTAMAESHLQEEEHLDVLTRTGEKTGVSKLRPVPFPLSPIDRSERLSSLVHRDGDYHRAVHVWIYSESTQELLLQKRADCKDSWPGQWDISSAGHISAGDSSLLSARRELYEELGIDLPKDAFELLFVFLQECVINNGNYINNEFNDVYLVTTLSPIPMEVFTVQESEVSSVKYIHWKDYKNVLEEGDEQYVPYDVTGQYGQLFIIIEQRHDGEESWTWQDTKKHSIGQNVVGGRAIMVAMVGEVTVDGEGVLTQVGVLLPPFTLVIILVFFLTIAEGSSGGGVGDELTLCWIPARSGCYRSIAECLTGDEFELGTELSGLSDADKEALSYILRAAMVVDDIFYLQLACSTVPDYMVVLKLLEPGCRSSLDENEAFLTTADSAVKLLAKSTKPVSGWEGIEYRAAFPMMKPPGANFYPPDMDKKEFELWKGSLNASEQEAATGFFSVIRRHVDTLSSTVSHLMDHSGSEQHFNLDCLTVVPFSQEYKALLVKAADLLFRASELSDSSSLKKLLETKGNAFLSNDYYESDIAWMELDSKLDVTIGPYETYEDTLFGYKATFEAFVGIRDDIATSRVKLFGDHLQDLEQNLPMDSMYKSKDVVAAPIRVIQLVYNAGDVKGPQTVAFNLPNDERIVNERGTSMVLLKNVSEAKFMHILQPIADVCIKEDQKEFIDFESFYTHTICHECCHGIGPHTIILPTGVQSTVRLELQELHSALEEAKADIVGLWALKFLVDQVEGAVENLSREILTIQAKGDKPAAMSLLQRYAKMTQPLRIALEKLERVQAKIMPFVVAKHVFFLLLLLLLRHVVTAHSYPLLATQIPQDKAALLAFKNTLTLQSQRALPNWNETTGVCEFVNVTCDRRHGRYVVCLELGSRLHSGHLSPVLANLTRLRRLDLSDNKLSGHIPREFSSLRRLELLDLSSNYLSGVIPPSLACLTSLGYLNLARNYFSGQIPASIFYNCTSLRAIDLSENDLSGQIPSAAGMGLPALSDLYLYRNYFTGRLPIWLSNSSFLRQLDVSNNHLGDELPTAIIQDKTKLEFLQLSLNSLSSHDNNTNLEPFFLTLSNCSELAELDIAQAGVGGFLPHAIGRGPRNLSTILLEDNLIFGGIPPDIANLTNLLQLDLSSNLLIGAIPREIFRISKLQKLNLSDNVLNGSIPPEIGNVVSFYLLDLSSNRLSGEIPSSIGNLVQISHLYLHSNELFGSIPATLGRCKSLNDLDLSCNRLTGKLPGEVSGIAKVVLNLSNNQLEGSLPAELSKMDHVQKIDLSANNFTGVIPPLSACVELTLINLSHNHLEGQLPTDLGNLRNLETLDVSFNGLDGEIPSSFNKCTRLSFFNLSDNDFTGWIPTGGVFSRFTNLSYLSNPRLCGPVLHRACRRRPPQWLHSRKFLIAISAGGSVVAFLLTLCCVKLVRKMEGMGIPRRGDIFGGSSPVVRSSYPRITYRELVEATEEFSQGRLVGSGSYGRVYRGVLRDGTVVAVKVLNLHTGNSTKSFNRECQVLKRIRHRNLMRIITACSLPDFKALVLPFMANGSLDSCLYSSSSDLSLIQRVNICSDIAEGMAYLHHHSPVKVIHCDLKPSNVLLNDDMTALVSDFGIARLVMNIGVGSEVENVGNSTANMLCGSIGYIAPEYGYGARASTKGDVYSFGVLVLEVVTRKRPTDEVFEGGIGMQQWVKSHYHGGAKTVVDSALGSEARKQTPEVRRAWEVAIGELLELGLICAQESPSSRPTMEDAADDLDRLKRYLAGDTTATFGSSLGMSSSIFGETSLSNVDD
ncbi:Peptidase family M49 [Musa troglodytarum]|uniref:non-specific serine/threonine protein kinase n=1 Tax=Musa troglodytarum TaxID=320322 RepID=A0A9E7I987_9LILI|nr:Peptidase family M49 [Musa troglodytarum]